MFLTASATKQPRFWIMSCVGNVSLTKKLQQGKMKVQILQRHEDGQFLSYSQGSGVIFQKVCVNELGKVKKERFERVHFTKANLSSAKPCTTGPCAGSCMLGGSFSNWERNTPRSSPNHCPSGITAFLSKKELGITMLKKCSFITSSHSCRG